jgi:hypothetical protein
MIARLGEIMDIDYRNPVQRPLGFPLPGSNADFRSKTLLIAYLSGDADARESVLPVDIGNP